MIYCIAQLSLLWSLAFGEIVPSFLGERTFFLEGDLLLLTSLDVTQNRNSKGQRERTPLLLTRTAVTNTLPEDWCFTCMVK